MKNRAKIGNRPNNPAFRTRADYRVVKSVSRWGKRI